jgi:photosystem II stability/assembly factor-like uncharacterized protein
VDELIRNKIHDALDVEAPADDLRYRVLSSLPAGEDRRPGVSMPAFQWAGGLVAALIAIAVVAGLLYTRGELAPQIATQSVGGPVSRTDSGMVTTTIGWYTNTEGHLMRTTDAGVHWTDVTPASFPQSINVGEFFLDGSHAWLAGTPGGIDATLSIMVFLTTDGGHSWKQGPPVGIPGPTPTLLYVPPSLFFIDSTHGWLFVSGTADGAASEFLYGTSDGGLNWRLTADSRSQPLFRDWAAVAFASLSTGWLTTGCGCSSFANGSPALVTRDGGATWKPQALPAPVNGSCPCLAAPPVFFDPMYGMLLLYNSVSSQTLLMTSDGGETWRARLLPAKVQLVVNFIDANHGWTIAGADALLGSAVYVPLYHTDDGGRTWDLVPTNLRLETKDGQVRDLYFVNDRDGFAARFANSLQPSQILKTADGGHTWTVITHAA